MKKKNLKALRAASPEAVLTKMLACSRWVQLSGGKTWQELYEAARIIGPYDSSSGLFWLWLAGHLSPEWKGVHLNAYDDVGLPCNVETCVALGCLPLEAWIDALGAAGHLSVCPTSTEAGPQTLQRKPSEQQP